MLQRTAVVSSSERVTQGAGQVLLGKGGLGYIARRGIDFGTSIALQTLEGVARMAVQQPLELLSLLPELVPEVGIAVWNNTFLACGPDSLRIRAVTRREGGGSEEAPEGTAAILRLWEGQPDEVGGLLDALGQNYQMLLFSGLAAVEAVPGPSGIGIKAVYPVNSLTLRFKREEDGTLALYQRQTANPNGLGIYSAGFGGMFLPMPMNRFFYSKLPALPDEPYGRAPFAAVLNVVLECLGFMRDLLLAWHRVGNPALDIGIDYEMFYKLATDIVGLTDRVEIETWVRQKVTELQNQYNCKQPDDAYFHDIKSKVSAISMQWPSFDHVWGMLRMRLIQALKQLPTLMGIVDGDTETWSKLQFEIFAASVKSMLAKAAYPLVKASNLHLQLLGMPYVAEPVFQELRSITRLVDAQAEFQEIQNEERKVVNNWQLNSTAAMVVTGSGPPSAEERAKDVLPKPPVAQVGMVRDGREGPVEPSNPGKLEK